MKKVMVTGHRPQTLNKLMRYNDFNDIPFMEYVDALNYEIDDCIRKGYDYFICGGAIGVDSDFAEIVLHQKGYNENLKLEIAVPCDNQDLKWTYEDKAKYRDILESADVVHQVGKQYTADCMHKRNMYMVDNSDLVLAFWNGEEKGGTYFTIKYAQSVGKPIEIIRLDKICKE